MRQNRWGRLAGLLAFALVAGVAGSSDAAFIDFNVGNTGVDVSNLYPGVTFGQFGADLNGTGPGPTPLAALPTVNGTVVTAPSPVSGEMAVSQSGVGARGILITFATLVNSVSLIGGDFGGNSVTDAENVTLTAFDSAGNVLGSTFFAPPFATPNLVAANIGFANMKHVAFTFSNTLGFFGFDNLEYVPVPEPSSVLLTGLGLGALGLAGYRRSRKVAA